MATISVTIKHGATSITLSDVPETSTLAQLKDLIDQQTGVIPQKQKLLCKGKVLTTLPTSTTLIAAGIANGSKLMLLTTAGGPVQTQGAATLQAVQRAKAEAPKRMRPDYTEAKTLTASSTIEARIKSWTKTGIVALRDLRLTQLPDEMFSPACADAVRVADLGGNQLTALPPSFSHLHRLQKLRLSLNCLTDAGMPWESLVSLTQLVVLAIDHNKLTFLPENFSKFTNLQKLSIDHNQLTSLPDSLGSLTSLKALNVSNNALTELPAALGNCGQLEEVSASDNAISEIPIGLRSLTNLKTLLLDNTKIRTVPPVLLTGAKSLSTLSLLGCPITLDSLRSTPGFEEYNERRKRKYDKQVGMKVLRPEAGFEEGADKEEWERWGKGTS